MDYIKEELRFYNQNKEAMLDHKFHFKEEAELSTSEKLEFLDKMADGRATYFLNIAKKYQAEKDTLKKDKWGYSVDNRSIRGWIKRNDPRHLIYDSESYSTGIGDMYVVTGFCHYRTNVLNYGAYNSMNDTVNNEEFYIKDWFRNLLINLAKSERELFMSTDEKAILINDICKMYNNGGVQNDVIRNIAYHDKGKDYDVETLKKLKALYEEANNKLLKAKQQFSDIEKGITASLEVAITNS